MKPQFELPETRHTRRRRSHRSRAYTRRPSRKCASPRPSPNSKSSAWPPAAWPAPKVTRNTFFTPAKSAARLESQTSMQTTGPFKKIGIISRPRGSNLAVVIPPLLEWLKARKLEIYYDTETAGALPDTSKGSRAKKSPKNRNCCSSSAATGHFLPRRKSPLLSASRFFRSTWAASDFLPASKRTKCTPRSKTPSRADCR